MNNTTNNYDESTNHDLPGEHLDWVHDEISGIFIDNPYAQSFPCGTYQDRWWDWNPATVGPDSEEPVYDEESMGADGDFFDDEDDRWSDSDSLTSCGWGEDEAYGCFE
tara:strand:- start:263 stop:586 length:324 start_codon:yes stop_codon:yes gene_type:complete